MIIVFVWVLVQFVMKTFEHIEEHSPIILIFDFDKTYFGWNEPQALTYSTTFHLCTFWQFLGDGNPFDPIFHSFEEEKNIKNIKKHFVIWWFCQKFGAQSEKKTSWRGERDTPEIVNMKTKYTCMSYDLL